jgi:two-component system response regulator YesN
MPYKVLIVDDEPIIRFGLSSCVNWQEEGLLLIGEASNGEAALSIMSEQDVNILITDIKMPIMDGLELTRLVKDLQPNIKVILVSSYTDFEFAREAVKLGVVVDYLLKPTMEPSDLQRILRICKERLDSDEARNLKVEKLVNQEMKQQLHRLEWNVKAYLSGDEPNFEWKPAWMQESLVIAVWKFDSNEQKEVLLQQWVMLEKAKDQLSAWCAHGITFITGDDEMVTLLVDRQGSGIADITAYHKRLIQEIGRYFTVGVSPVISHFRSVRDAFKWAVTALDTSFYEGKGQIYLGRIPSNAQQERAGGSIEMDERMTILREQFSKAIASADNEACTQVFDQYVALWRQRIYTRSEIVIQARSLLIILGPQHFTRYSEDGMQQMMIQLVNVEKAPTLDALTGMVRQELQRLWEPDHLRVLSDDAGGVHIIQLALSYIQEHYRREVSLQEVADHVHMSKNYFSEQFKKRTGHNFIDFVIRLRLHYAKHLLESTTLRVGEVGQQAGFNSPKHFLKLFKRQIGSTPLEYREHYLLTKSHRIRDEDEVSS